MMTRVQVRMLSMDAIVRLIPVRSTLDCESVRGEDVKPPDYVHKGRRGPGQWHCYVAVIDGSHSSIRIDGSPEIMTHFINDDSKGSRVLLDGLTIGSDHSFDMSLRVW
jgi:hypothetical protein